MKTAILTATRGVAVGQREYTTAGTYTFTIPSGIDSVSVVCVGGGGGGGGYDFSGNAQAGHGGCLAYKNNIAVEPGEEWTVVVGARGPAAAPGDNGRTAGGESYFAKGVTEYCRAAGAGTMTTYRGAYTGDGGGLSGLGYPDSQGGGGGAGGYGGDGGDGGNVDSNGTAGQDGGGGGGGGGANAPDNEYRWAGAGGGGVGIYGIGTSGAGGLDAEAGAETVSTGGGGGSGGTDGESGTRGSWTFASRGGEGGDYGGGAGVGAPR